MRRARSKYFKKISVLIVGLIARSYVPYILLGLWIRAFGGWQSVFFCYSGGEDYRRAYAPGRIAEAFKWMPCPIGVLRQGGARGLVLASSMTEAEFLDPANAARLQRCLRRLRRIAWLVGAPQIHMAGILPGLLRDPGLQPGFDARAVTADLIARAVAQLGPPDAPVIVLGGQGYIGAALVARLRSAGRAVTSVDSRHGAEALPAALRGRPAILVDAARRGALAGYLDQMWPGLTVLNEVFPEPGPALRRQLAARGVALWHLAGAEGRIWPDLPGGYAGAVPCCAVHLDNGALRPVLKELVPARPM